MTGSAGDKRRARRRLGWVARVGVTAVALAWTFTQITLDDLGRALLRLDALTACAALALTVFNLGLGAFRWRLLLLAYGGRRLPPLLRLFHVYLVGLFYNTFLPANVGGDVLRGFVTRRVFQGKAGAYLIVLIERVFGLAGLLLLAGAVILVHPLEDLAYLSWLAAVGMVAAAGATAIPFVGRSLGRFLPGLPGRLLSELPTAQRPMLFLAVLLLSVCTQAIVAITGHVLIHAIAPEVALGTSLVLVPVALAAMYFPTIAGLGAREAAFILLFGSVGVSESDATAASIAFFAVQLLVALGGGAANLLPLPAMVDSTADEAPDTRHGTISDD